jgi:pimeloyl-ACP methyl ester carboxylesterase
VPRPDLLLVHGAWHGAWAWEPLWRRLVDEGWTVRTVDLPSSGSTAGLDADVQRVRDLLAAHPVPTLVVGHSYGGIVVSEACAGVDHVVGLGYVCAFLLDVGESLAGALPALPDWIEVDGPAGVTRARRPEQVFFADLPGDLAAASAARLQPQSLASFTTPQTQAAWRALPSAYLLCEQDRAIPPSAQEAMSDRAGRVVRLASGHSPFLSQPGGVVAFLEQLASAGGLSAGA